MYKVEKFEVRDPKTLLSVMEQYPFATVTSVVEGKPFVNHLPITTKMLPDGQIKLMGHMSRRNPQWRHFEVGSTVVIAFHGPHAYVNPNWYVEHDVPTWNYVVVHATGTVRLVKDYAGITEILKETTEHMNRLDSNKWKYYLPPDLEMENDLTAAIIGFEMTADEMLGKFKLSQNRSSADRKSVVAGLKRRNDEGSQRIASWMSELIEKED